MVKIKKKNLCVSESVQQRNKKQVNPFEVHINRNKQRILGQKNKNDRGLPGVSKAKAISKRKQSLLEEYKLQNKDNVFLDKRIGECNSTMSMEEKALARFAKERMKAYKKESIFNLNDEVLTHRGQTLEEIEKFDDPKSDDEFSDNENVSGKLDKNFVEAHFGGGILSKADFTLSRKDLINQLIIESKKRKAEKQKVREQTIDLTEKLDSEWRDLLPLMPAPTKSTENNDETKADTYDIAVRQLKFEVRGNPSEKLKSEDEIIREEKEKLEKLEIDRLARMNGFTDDINQCKHKSADDLEDDFIMDTIEDNNVGSTGIDVDDNESDEVDEQEEKLGDATDEEIIIDMKKRKNNNESQETICAKSSKHAEDESDTDLNDKNSKIENDEESEDDLSDLKISGSSSEDESETKVTFAEKSKKHVIFINDPTKDTILINQDKMYPKSILKQNNNTHVQNLSDENEEQQVKSNLLKQKEIMEKALKELPYTYNAPETFEELEKLLRPHDADSQSAIVHRIIKCNHWTLGGKNREKMLNLFVYLLQYINDCASIENVDDLIKCFQIFDRLCPYLYDLAHMDPENAKMCIQEVIKEKHNEFEKNKTRYPGIDTLIFLKLVSLLFPTSDFRHSVVTPCLVFMSQILLRGHIKKYRSDISKGLFICTLILEYTILSKRFAPSVINFLQGIIYMATPADLTQKIKIIPPFKSACKVLVINKTENVIDQKGTHMFASDLIEEELNDEFRIRVLLTAINLLTEFRSQLQELEAAYPIFQHVSQLLKINKFKQYPSNVRDYIKKLRKEFELLRNKKLEYIVLEKKKPKPLRTYEPKIMTIYDGKQHKFTSKEKVEKEKLLHKYKREFKGAIREIRRDRDFLAKVQIGQQIKSDADCKRKVMKIFGEAAISMQQNEPKKMKKR